MLNTFNQYVFAPVSLTLSQKKLYKTTPPNVLKWSQRHYRMSAHESHRVVGAAVRPTIIHKSSFRHGNGQGFLKGGSAEAKEMYKKLHWQNKTSSKPVVDVTKYPLDVLVVDKASPQKFDVDPPSAKKYRRAALGYKQIHKPCIVCTRDGLVMAVFVTSDVIPQLSHISKQARAALVEAERDLPQRKSWKGGMRMNQKDRTRATLDELKNRSLQGTVWNDGLQTYMSKIPGWQGLHFTQYMKRRPGSNPTIFSLPFVSMYNVEKSVVPAIADVRLKLADAVDLPGVFPGLHRRHMPATQVGISKNFGVKTHVDSCIDALSESIFWGNRNLKGAMFAVTSTRTAFDIGSKPCMLFQRGSEMHGTVPNGPKGSVGLVLISKRNTLYQYRKNDYMTDRVLVQDS